MAQLVDGNQPFFITLCGGAGDGYVHGDPALECRCRARGPYRANRLVSGPVARKLHHANAVLAAVTSLARSPRTGDTLALLPYLPTQPPDLLVAFSSSIRSLGRHIGISGDRGAYEILQCSQTSQ